MTDEAGEGSPKGQTPLIQACTKLDALSSDQSLTNRTFLVSAEGLTKMRLFRSQSDPLRPYIQSRDSITED